MVLGAFRCETAATASEVMISAEVLIRGNTMTDANDDKPKIGSPEWLEEKQRLSGY
jgi:hypothetical protein